jgi:lipoyl(octanoyl) transferase
MNLFRIGKRVMEKIVKFQDLGLIDYKEAWDLQEELLGTIINSRKKGSDRKSEVAGELLFCEHPHVYTIGKSGSEENLLIHDEQLKAVNATYYKINRGGDITYHGPGQIVGYPILDLEVLKIGIRKYIFLLEEAIIQTLIEKGVKSSRLDGATGVWLDADKPERTRKICAIGVRVSRFVTMHGFAFNVKTNLDYFRYINPCGFVDKGVTSLEKELGEEVSMEAVKNILKQKLSGVFGFRLKE